MPTRSLPLLLLASSLGCATAAPRERVDLETVKIVVDPTGSDAFDVYDASTLFERGLDLLHGNAHREAVEYFTRVPEEFPESPLAIPSWFNQAVCWLALDDGERALAAIDTYLAALPPSAAEKHFIDGRFKRGAALMQLKRYEEAAEVFDVLIVDVTEPSDQVEALVDSGVAHFMLEDRVTAEYRFLKARRVHDQASKLERLSVMFFMAQAQFYLAEIARLDFSDFKLRYPTAEELAKADAIEGVLGQQLETKCQLLLRAQYAFTRTIRQGHTGWASAAGYKVGSMYEELYADLVALPEPDDLSDDQKRMFKELMREKVLILLEKAVKIWQATAEMATRTGEQNLWVEKTRQSLERVRTFVLTEHDTATPPSTSES